MNHSDHVRLIRGGVVGRGGTWADLGAGDGAFTLALAELVGAAGMIYAVDRDAGALRRLESAWRARFPEVALRCVVADFTARVELEGEGAWGRGQGTRGEREEEWSIVNGQLSMVNEQIGGRGQGRLDGIVMANSLHFVKQKEGVLANVRRMLRSGGRLVVVEYNTDRGNTWVPYPLTFSGWEVLATRCGFVHTELLATHPSSFLGEFYAAVTRQP